jgi:hypothetical protein
MSDELPASITLTLNLGRESVRISTIPVPHDAAMTLARALDSAVWDFIRQCDRIRAKTVMKIVDEVLTEGLGPEKKGEACRSNPRQ